MNLDYEVAEKVMGWQWHDQEWPSGAQFSPFLCPPGQARGRYAVPAFSSLVGHAWQVVCRMHEHQAVRYSNLKLVEFAYNRSYATFDGEAFDDYDSETWAEGNGPHCTPEAICRAALMAVSCCPFVKPNT